jgi:hypothetical protein
MTLATSRNAPVVCDGCGRKVQRRSRQQRYCSRRCRQRGNYSQKVARGDFSGRTIALPTNLIKKRHQINEVQRAKTLSSTRIIGPPQVIAIELFDRLWESTVSPDGIVAEVSRLRPRALFVR